MSKEEKDSIRKWLRHQGKLRRQYDKERMIAKAFKKKLEEKYGKVEE